MAGPTSLRHRLVLGAVLVGIIFAVVFGGIAGWSVEHNGQRALCAALDSRLELARDEVRPDGTMAQGAGSPKTDLVQVLGPDGAVRATSPALAGFGPLARVPTVYGAGSCGVAVVALAEPDVDLAVLAVPYQLDPSSAGPGGSGALLVATDAEGFTSATAELGFLLALGLLGVIVVIGLLTWFITGRALSSVTTLTESAEAARPHELSAGLPVPVRDTELARMVGALNRMLARLAASHATELAFAADAGHRLRTPVATLRAEAELAQHETDPVELTAALSRIVDDADHLTLIVNRMLARAGARSRPPEPVRTTVEAKQSQWLRQAQIGGVNLTLSIQPQVTSATCCHDLTEILDPVIDNAIRHTPAGGRVEVTVAARKRPGPALQIDVANTGSFVDPALRGRLFDAWVSSRDASTTGGLGLWLARETARDTGGDVQLLEDRDATTFQITVPVLVTTT